MTIVRLCISILALFGLCACMAVTPDAAPVAGTTSANANAKAAARRFIEVVAQVEPVAERFCRNSAPDLDCDLRIIVDARPNQPANAYQTIDAHGRPVIVFSLSLIYLAENADELAFVMGHEAAHHIAGHFARARDNAFAGAVLGGVLAGLAGGDAATVDAARDLGAAKGALQYSKRFELEADALGTRIAYLAGYDPEIGAVYFSRIPDPGVRFLATHPPNSARIAAVRQTLADLR